MKKLSEIIDEFSKVLPTRGPYSFSRLGNCALKFKKQYIDKEQGLQTSRWQTGFGSAMHELLELDVEMRVKREPEHWIAVEELVEFYLERAPEYSEHAAALVDQLHMFHFNFPINAHHYVASEQKLGAGLKMEWMDYDECWFRGKIDYLEIDAGSGTARVVDFKNYPRIHTDYEIADYTKGVGKQLMGYIALVMAMFPQVIQATYEVYYTRFGTSRQSCAKDEMGTWQTRYISRDEVIRWWKYHQREMLAFERRQEFPAQPAQRECQYCPFLKTCDWYVEYGAEEFLATSEEEAHLALDELVVLKEREKRIKHMLDSFEDGLKSSGGDFYGYIETEKLEVDPKVFFHVCKKAGFDPLTYISISKTNIGKLEKRLGDKPELLEVLQEGIVRKKATRKVSPR